MSLGRGIGAVPVRGNLVRAVTWNGPVWVPCSLARNKDTKKDKIKDIIKDIIIDIIKDIKSAQL